MKPCVRCNWEASPVHSPCCSSHGKNLCCPCYRHTHFVETGCCQPAPDGKSIPQDGTAST